MNSEELITKTAFDLSAFDDLLFLDVDAALAELQYQLSEEGQADEATRRAEAQAYWEGECGGCLAPRFKCVCEEEL